ncbi:site-specific DNA-methyltransferase [Staphylococcus epidermidis]|uniref:site-specific DNA-methyltransferase n=1 Tax=Staphylococcus epidermidis TaxID=1282 RepID=UPI00339855BF
MTNLSQIKRERMKKFIQSLRESNNNDDQIKLLNEIENFLDEKRYGLIWEEHEEEIDVKMRDNIPVFKEDKSKKIISDSKKPINFILEGDNLHSLYLLEKTHKNKIDIIYIDPPYNTNNSLTYDDKRIGDDDAFRHSMWLSFMSERLKRAKVLLNKQGLIFISIDDNEGYNLKLLCDEIFGEQNFMGSFSITKSEGGGQAKYIVKGHDLLLVYAKNLVEAKPLGRAKDIRGKIFEKNGENYWIQEDAYRKFYGKYGNLHYEEILEYRDQTFKEEIDRKIKNDEIKLIYKEKNGMHALGKVRKLSDDYSKYHSVLKQLNAKGKSDLAAFGMDELFDYPKPVNLIKELIAGAAFLRPGKLRVLDFFAGSGTTGQATMEFVQETGRDVEFILCTNNEVSAKQKLNFVKSYGYLEKYKPSSQTTDTAIENKIDKELEKYGKNINDLISLNPNKFESYGICQSVTLPRIAKVISGFDWQSKGSKVLYKKKLTEKNLTRMTDFLMDIEKIKNEHDYEKFKIRIDDNANLILEAEVKSGEHYNSIPSNLKYFKTDFISRKPDDRDSLGDVLLNHIKEMAELEYNVDLETSSKIKLVMDEEELDDFFETKTNKDLTLLVPTFVLLKGSQELDAEHRNIKLVRIPDYYFATELKEAGEL